MAVPPPAPFPDKAALRGALRARRAAFADALGASGRAAAERALAGRLVPALAGARTVAAYLPHGVELGLGPALAALDTGGMALALPAVLDRAGAMRFVRWRPGDPLVEGLFGIPEPPGDGPEATPDLILAPLVGFDRRGGRLGQGGGYYDRAFERLPDARRIGIGWSVQEAPPLPLDAWDRPLHAIATEAEWITIP